MNEKYQGWTNAKTWCVAARLDNEKTSQDKAIKLSGKNNALSELRMFVESPVMRISIMTFANWAWPFRSLKEFQDVNYKELVAHFQDKVIGE